MGQVIELEPDQDETQVAVGTGLEFLRRFLVLEARSRNRLTQLQRRTETQVGPPAEVGQLAQPRMRPSGRWRPLTREWQGTEHCVLVSADGQDWEGRRSPVSAIAGTEWKGWVFFDLKSQRSLP